MQTENVIIFLNNSIVKYNFFKKSSNLIYPLQNFNIVLRHTFLVIIKLCLHININIFEIISFDIKIWSLLHVFDFLL